DEGAYVISTFTKIKDQESRVITGGSGAANSTNDSDASADGKADTKSTTSSKSTDTKTGK
ncbi:hypothetical protein, partial [Bifidobacterium sp. M0353]